MPSLLPLSLTGFALAGILSPATALAHGGQYRGPSGVIPPSSANSAAPQPSSGAGTGGSAPSAGAPAPATRGGPSRPSGPTSPGASAGGGAPGIPVGEDLARWSCNWAFRKAPYLQLRHAVHHVRSVVRASDDAFMGSGSETQSSTLRPTAAQIRDKVLPALHRTLATTKQRDITSSCLVALAKIGMDGATGDQALLPALVARLASKDQEIRETAALSLGIAQRDAAAPFLIALATDSEDGRRLCGRIRVDTRTRAFACYGIGLASWASTDMEVKRRALRALTSIIDDDDIAGMHVQVAALNAFGLLRPASGTDHDEAEAMRLEALATLERHFATNSNRRSGTARQIVQAHIPTAIAALLENGASDRLRGAWAERLAACLKPRFARQHGIKRNRFLEQSATLALGNIAAACIHLPGQDSIAKTLRSSYQHASDVQSRYFALISMATIGSADSHTFLLDVLETGSKALERPWAALALGMMAQRPPKDADPQEQSAFRARITRSTAAIQRQIMTIKNPETRSAYAVALGLCGATEAAPQLRELLKKNAHQEEFAGYLCMGLGLMQDRASASTIRSLVTSSNRRPRRLVQAAIALGRLGDKSTAELLVDTMSETGDNIAVLAATAIALGQIGDRRSIDPLLNMVNDRERSDLARAFAVVALGSVADKEDESWGAKIGRQVNYRAAVETLTNQANGILDIL